MNGCVGISSLFSAAIEAPRPASLLVSAIRSVSIESSNYEYTHDPLKNHIVYGINTFVRSTGEMIASM